MASHQQLVFDSIFNQCTVKYRCINDWVLWCHMDISPSSSHRTIFASLILKLNQPCLRLLALSFPAKVWIFLFFYFIINLHFGFLLLFLRFLVVRFVFVCTLFLELGSILSFLCVFYYYYSNFLFIYFFLAKWVFGSLYFTTMYVIFLFCFVCLFVFFSMRQQFHFCWLI
jgi:hypothetical protein